MWKFIALMMPYALAFTAPLLVCALGGMISERSGVSNIGLEGLMVVGTFTAALTVWKGEPVLGTSSIWIAVLAAMLVSGLFSLLHAYASISLKANQIISGLAINLLAPALTVFIVRSLNGAGTIHIIKGISRSNIPFLSDIPILGSLLFTQAYLTTFLVFFLALLLWFIMSKTQMGLRIHACGENPQAAQSLGINVIKIRYLSVFFSGVFAGLGGAIIVLTYHGEFTGSVSGLGFLALATLIFGQWKPLNILCASIMFGFMRTLGTMAMVVPSLKTLNIPSEIYNAFPYVITIIVVALISKKSTAPKALAEPFDISKR